MSDGVLGGLGLGLFGLMVLSLVLSARRRSPEAVITLGEARGRPGLAIHPWRGGHWLTTAVGRLLLALIVLFALSAIESSNYAAGLLLVGALLMGYVGWCRATGRAGDGTVTLTPEGIHQLYAGSEVFIDWPDVRGLVTTPTDFVVKTARPVIPIQHMLPLVAGRRGVVTDDAIALPRRNLPPLPFQEMIETYSTGSAARDELGTDEVVQRARGILAMHTHRRPRLGRGRDLSADSGDAPDLQGPAGTMELVLDVLLVVACGWVLWITAGAQAAQLEAASGNGRPGAIVIDGLRPARGPDIPVGTFTERDGTVTPGVAWQDRPAAVGERKEGVRVRDRAWEPGVRLGVADVLVATTVVGLFAWRVLALLRRWRRRRSAGH